jgi:hypothetical protein
MRQSKMRTPPFLMVIVCSIAPLMLQPAAFDVLLIGFAPQSMTGATKNWHAPSKATAQNRKTDTQILTETLISIVVCFACAANKTTPTRKML